MDIPYKKLFTSAFSKEYEKILAYISETLQAESAAHSLMALLDRKITLAFPKDL